MIIIAGTLRVDPGTREEYLTAASSATAMARSAAGCVDFAQSPDPLEPDRINIFELWDSDAQLEDYRALPSDGESPPILSADVKRYRISGVEAP